MANSIKWNSILNIIRKTCNILLPLLIYPYISRVLGPDNYGKYSFATSIIGYFILIAMLGIETYAVREGARLRDNRIELERFISEIFSINVMLAVVCIIILFGAIWYIPRLNSYRELLYILSLMIPCTVLSRDYINIIYEDFFYITIRYIAIQIAGIIAVYILVRSSNDYKIYTAIQTFTSCLGCIVNLIYTHKYIKIRVTGKVNLKRHIFPILVLFCGQLAVNIYVQSDITMLGLMKTDTEVGIYTITSRIYLLIKGMINALTMVMVPRISYYLGKRDEEQYQHFSNQLFSWLVLMAIPLAVGLFVFSDSALYIVGGKDYLSGETTLKVLSVALTLAVFSGYYCNAIMVPNRKEKQFLFVTALSAVINIALNLFLIPALGMLGAAVTTLISETVVLAFAIKMTKAYCAITVNKRNAVSVCVGGLAILVISLLCKLLISNCIAALITAVIISGIAYSFILLCLKNTIAVNTYRTLLGRYHGD